MMTEQIEKFIYIIRHGESAENVNDVFQGPDSPLTALGHKQALFVAERAQALGAEVILASPMPRARDTARAIQEKTGIPLETLELLREYLPPSGLIGKPRMSDEGKAYVTEMIAHMDDPMWHYADEDNYHDLHKHCVALLTLLITRPEKKIILVTHAGLTRVLLTAMMTEGVADAELTRKFMRFLKPMYTGITICRYHSDAVRRNKWRLITWNDHAHLGETRMEEPVETPV